MESRGMPASGVAPGVGRRPRREGFSDVCAIEGGWRVWEEAYWPFTQESGGQVPGVIWML